MVGTARVNEGIMAGFTREEGDDVRHKDVDWRRTIVTVFQFTLSWGRDMSMSCARNSSSKAFFPSFQFSIVKNMRCVFMSSLSVYFF